MKETVSGCFSEHSVEYNNIVAVKYLDLHAILETPPSSIARLQAVMVVR